MIKSFLRSLRTKVTTECKELKFELAQEKKEIAKLLKKESEKNSYKNASNKTSSKTVIYKYELCGKPSKPDSTSLAPHLLLIGLSCCWLPQITAA